MKIANYTELQRYERENENKMIKEIKFISKRERNIIWNEVVRKIVNIGI